ncbi:MAG: hypothetical protein GYB66_03300 [Chloroflexi bacterium]|nr:hypothetical protein [Chloroflexota bacterium]
MLKTLMISVLTVTVIGSLGIAIYDGSQVEESKAEDDKNPAITRPIDESAQAHTPTAPEAESDLATDETSESGSDSPLTQPNPDQQQQGTVGEPWSAIGELVSVDEFGFTLQTPEGNSFYVELGPPTYWQAQGVMLYAGERVIVEGFVNADQYHARTVIKANGATLNIRTETGQPLWSGGATNTQASQGQGGGTGQVQVDEWVTFEGTILAVGRNSLTVQTTDGQQLMIQLGQPGFADSQDVSFAVGDSVSLLGFWQEDQFQAGEITNLATGDRLMLRDPNGRPLWGGPGRNGESQGQGQGQQGTGQGNQWRGGRNQ